MKTGQSVALTSQRVSLKACKTLISQIVVDFITRERKRNRKRCFATRDETSDRRVSYTAAAGKQQKESGLSCMSRFTAAAGNHCRSDGQLHGMGIENAET